MCITCVDQSERGVKQCNGKFQETVGPGCHCYICPFQEITPVVMKVQQLDITTNTKTADDVTVTVCCAVQWQVQHDKVDEYYFKVSDPCRQITAYVDDIIRAQLPVRTLDAAFAEKETMGRETEDLLRCQMSDSFGIAVIKVLITDLRPDHKVMSAMNEINAAKREREATRERAEAQKVLTVMNAEAEAEAKKLAGTGLASMRREIATGFKNSIVDLTGEEDMHSNQLTAQGVVHMMLVTQYLDVLKEFASSGRSSMVVPHGAGFVSDVENQVRTGFWSAQELKQRGPSGAGRDA
eukprot:TRINITY_DN1068_c0_g1_i1.p1 TRINITY_DN1068_c0_g1~~TRINITY_DN1068_c0_g1_i1.p1  ORF type:complete len:329 (+),score=107.54 TRINITY_DN1068_c0_g1_i1:105-989(+)